MQFLYTMSMALLALQPIFITLSEIYAGKLGKGLSVIAIEYNYHHSTKLYHKFVAVCIVTSAQHE